MVTNHHTIILQQQSHQVLSPILVLFLQSQAMSASSSVGQLSYSSSSMLYSEWILDSTVSHHMSPDSLSFAYVPLSFSIHVMIIDGTSFVSL